MFKLLFPNKSDRGASLVEYGILTGLVAVASIATVLNLGQQVEGTFSSVESTLSSNIASASGADEGGSNPPANPPTEVFQITAIDPLPVGSIGSCNHQNCFSQGGATSQSLTTNWNIVGSWTQGAVFNLMISGHHKASIDANINYEVSCDGAPAFPFSNGYNSNEQGVGGNSVTYVRMSFTGAPYTGGSISSCEIRPT